MDREPEIYGGYLQPWSSAFDFSHVLPFEDWAETKRPHYLAYSTGTLPNAEAGGENDVKKRTKAFLAGPAELLWPGAYTNGVFNWKTLRADNADCEARLDQQYFRANTDPTSRYVTAGPKTRQLRINTDHTELENLNIAGEWTETEVNISSVEATVISGMRASRKISRFPATIPGEHDA